MGCGDLSLYNNNLFFKKYTGVDIVDIKKYKNLSVDIIVSSIESLKFDLYDFDLIIIKDVFQHLTNYRINNILKILSLIDVDVLITNDFNRDTFNLDCKDGDYRSLNMETDPFNCKIKSKFNWISYFDNRLKQSVLI